MYIYGPLVLTIHWLLSHGVVFTITSYSLLLPFPLLLACVHTPYSLFLSPHTSLFLPSPCRPSLLCAYSIPLISSCFTLSFPSSPLYPRFPFPSLPSPFILPSPPSPSCSQSAGTSRLEWLLYRGRQEPALPSEGEGLSLDHMSVSEGSGKGNKGEGKEG